MSTHLFGLPGDEDMCDDVSDVAERAWDDGMTPPITVEEWTSKPLRHFARADLLIEHVLEVQLEEAYDPYGDIYDQLSTRCEAPEVLAAFNAALDALLADTTWRWADRHVADWTVTWDADDPDDPSFTFTRKSSTP